MLKNDVLPECSCTSWKRSIEEVNPVVTEKDELEYRDKSNLKALFGIPGLSGFLSKDKNE